MAWRSGFSPRSAKVGFVADIVQLGQDFLWVLQHSHQYHSINAPHCCIHSSIRHYTVLAIDSLTIWSTQVLSQLGNSLHLMKMESSLPCLLDPATGLHC
jgi:hypothetical protein